MGESPVKVLLDTSIYIPHINDGVTHPNLAIKSGRPLVYMSAVVMQELYTGALDPVTSRLLDRLYRTFKTIGRLVTPLSGDWRYAGKVISKMGAKYGFENLFLSRLLNDALIALTARRIGAFVVTANTKDFLKLKEFVNFKLD